MRNARAAIAASVLVFLAVTKDVRTNPTVKAQQGRQSFDQETDANVKRMYEDGQRIFRHDTFGSEAFWGDKLQLHRAILGEKQGGVGPGISPKDALKVGLKVDQGSMPKAAVEMVKRMSADLDKPETTVALLKADAVVGVKGVFKGDKLVSVGIECALCHSTVDDSLTAGIGRRRDGWPNRDLDVGAIVAMAPNLKAYADILGLDEATLKKVLLSWDPGSTTPK
jgi:hypothetical protein